MKILEIYIKGIHSLKDENTIDFRSGILKDAGLYAITGQTGAGKSTILDAITLSLYGETNRHGRGAAEEIITRNAREAVAETLFQVNNTIYKARWAVSKNRNNRLNDWEQKLFEQLPDGSFKLLADKKKIAQDLIVKTVGLTYEQFTKSVLLAQNNFAAFLKASANERAEMLSRITGTSIYERVSVWVFDQAKAQADALQQLKNQVKTDLLTAEMVAQLQAELLENEQQVLELKKQIEFVQKHQNWIKEIEELENNIAQNETDVALLQQQLQEIQPEIALLHRYKQALTLQPQLLAFQFAEKQQQEIAEKLATLTTEIANSQQQLPELESMLSAKKDLAAAEEQTLNAQLPFIEEAKQLNQQLQTVHQQITEDQQQLEKLLNDRNLNQKALQTCFVQKQQAEAQLVNINNQIISYQPYAEWPKYEGVLRNIYGEIEKNEKLAANIHIQNFVTEIQAKEHALAEKNEHLKGVEAQLQLLQQQQQDIINQLQKHPPLATCYQQQQQNAQTTAALVTWKDHMLKKREIEADIHQTTQLLNQSIATITNLEANMHHATERKKELSLSLDVQKAMHGLAAHRASLKDGEACPLCGALDHPYADELPPLAISETEIKLQSITETLQQLQADWQQQKDVSVACRLRIAQSKKELQQVVEQIQQQVALVDQQPLDDVHAIEELIKYAQKEEQAQRRITLQIEGWTKEKEALDANVNQIKEKQQKLHLSVQQLTLALAETHKKKEREEQQLVIYQQQITDLLEQASQSFSELGSPLTELTKDAVAKQGKKMKEGYQFYDDFTKRQLDFQNQIKALENELFKYNSAADLLEQQKITTESSLNTKLQQQQTFLQRWEIVTKDFVLKDPSQEEERLRNALKVAQQEQVKAQLMWQALDTKLQQQREQFKQTQQQKDAEEQEVTVTTSSLKAALLQNGFLHLDDLQQALSFANATAIEQQQQAIVQQQTRTETLLTQHLKRKDELTKQPYERIEIEQLQQQIQGYQQEYERVNRAMGAKNEQLQKDAAEKNANEQFLQQIVQQETITAQWEQLSKLIGSRNGDAFKRFAQDLTLSLLVQLANNHLSVMYDRYELYKDDLSEEMELQIKDKHFFNEIRSINSLSGGETFLVSLALALGLSDLASRNIKIQSLFIDEGFGSLDPESLSSALDALELLQQYGNRQIGIISHIEELKKRVYTQVRVVKTSAEFSKIVVEG